MDLIGRGFKILIIAYVLNFVRSGMFFLSYDSLNGALTENSLKALFESDILQFAGLALIFTGVLKKLKLKETYIFAIGLILSMLGTMVAFTDTGNHAVNILTGLFIFTTHEAATFSFCNWYIFVAVGVLFGKILQDTKKKDKLYLWVLIVAGILMAAYIFMTVRFGMMPMSPGHMYYAASPIDAFGLLSIDFFLLSVFHFLLKMVNVSKLGIFVEMSKNINSIYCIHWCIIGALEFVFCFLLGWVPNYAVLYLCAIAIVIVSFLLARLYQSQKTKYLQQRGAVQ